VGPIHESNKIARGIKTVYLTEAKVNMYYNFRASQLLIEVERERKKERERERERESVYLKQQNICRRLCVTSQV
jgi:hypothetical protein